MNKRNVPLDKCMELLRLVDDMGFFYPDQVIYELLEKQAQAEKEGDHQTDEAEEEE